MRKVVSAVSGSALVLALAFSGQAANAAPLPKNDVVPYACPEYPTFYSVSGKQTVHIGSGNIFKSGKGGTVYASVQSSLSATLGVSAAFTVSSSALVAKAEATYGLNASVTANKTSSESYSHVVSPDKYGNLQYGNWGWKMAFKKYTVNQYCNVTATQSGTITKMPSASTWGYRYWETYT